MRAEQSRAEQSRAEHELTGFPSVDKPWLKYYGEEVMHRPLPEGSIQES